MKSKLLVSFLILLFGIVHISDAQSTFNFKGKTFQVYPLQHKPDYGYDDFVNNKFDLPPIIQKFSDGDYVYLYNNIKSNRNNIFEPDTQTMEPDVFATFSIQNGQIEGPASFYSSYTEHSANEKLLLYDCIYAQGIKNGKVNLYQYIKNGKLNDISTCFFVSGLLQGVYTRTNYQNTIVESGFFTDNQASGKWIKQCIHGVYTHDYNTSEYCDSLFLPSPIDQLNAKLIADGLDIKKYKVYDQCHNEEINKYLDQYCLVKKGYLEDTMKNVYGYDKFILYDKATHNPIFEIIDKAEEAEFDNIQNIIALYPEDFLPAYMQFNELFDIYLTHHSRVKFYSNQILKSIDFAYLSREIPVRNIKVKWGIFKKYYYKNQVNDSGNRDEELADITVHSSAINGHKILKINAMIGSTQVMEHNYVLNYESFEPYYRKTLYGANHATHDTPYYLIEYNNVLQKILKPGTYVFDDSTVELRELRRIVKHDLVLYYIHEYGEGKIESKTLLTQKQLNALKKLNINQPIISQGSNKIKLFKFTPIARLNKHNFNFSRLDTVIIDFSELNDMNGRNAAHWDYNMMFDNLGILKYSNNQYFLNYQPFSGFIKNTLKDSINIYWITNPSDSILFIASDTTHDETFRFFLNNKFILENTYPFKNGTLDGKVGLFSGGYLNCRIAIDFKNGIKEGKQITEFDTARINENPETEFLIKYIIGNKFNLTSISKDDSILLNTTIARYIQYIKDKEESRDINKLNFLAKEDTYVHNYLEGPSTATVRLANGSIRKCAVNFKKNKLDGPADLIYLKTRFADGIPNGKIYFYDSSLNLPVDSLFSKKTKANNPLISGKINIIPDRTTTLLGNSIHIQNNKIKDLKFEFLQSEKLNHRIWIDTSIEYIQFSQPDKYDNMYSPIIFNTFWDINLELEFRSFSHFSANSSSLDYQKLINFKPLSNTSAFQGIQAGDLQYYPGKHTWYYPNGNLALAGQVNIYKQLTGNWQYYYTNGAKMLNTNFSNARASNYNSYNDLTVSLFDTQGQYFSSIKFTDLEFDSLCESHQLIPTGEFDVIDWPKNQTDSTGNYHFVLRHENGMVKTEGRINTKGQKNGIWKTYNRSGLPIEIGRYKNNQKTGYWISGDLSMYANLDNLCSLDSQSLIQTSKMLSFNIAQYLNNKRIYSTHFNSYKMGKDEFSGKSSKKYTIQDTLEQLLYSLEIKYNPESNQNPRHFLYNSSLYNELHGDLAQYIIYNQYPETNIPSSYNREYPSLMTAFKNRSNYSLKDYIKQKPKK